MFGITRLFCLLDISCHVYADYAKILGINYIDTIGGITEKIQIKANRISHVFTVHSPVFLMFLSQSSHPCTSFFLWPCVHCGEYITRMWILIALPRSSHTISPWPHCLQLKDYSILFQCLTFYEYWGCICFVRAGKSSGFHLRLERCKSQLRIYNEPL